MFIKRVHTRGVVYLQLVESYWEAGQSKHRVLKSLGREDALDPKEVVRLRASLKRYGSAEAGGVSVDLDDVGLEPGRRVGALLPLQALWGELGLGDILSGLASGRRFSFDVATIVKAIVFQRVLAPGSERALVGSWLRGVHAPEFEGIELQHAYRVLKFLAEVGPELEAKLTSVLMQRLFADASLVLFDTTVKGHLVSRGWGTSTFPQGCGVIGWSPGPPVLGV